MPRQILAFFIFKLERLPADAAFMFQCDNPRPLKRPLIYLKPSFLDNTFFHDPAGHALRFHRPRIAPKQIGKQYLNLPFSHPSNLLFGSCFVMNCEPCFSMYPLVPRQLYSLCWSMYCRTASGTKYRIDNPFLTCRRILVAEISTPVTGKIWTRLRSVGGTLSRL